MEEVSTIGLNSQAITSVIWISEMLSKFSKKIFKLLEIQPNSNDKDEVYDYMETLHSKITSWKSHI